MYGKNMYLSFLNEEIYEDAAKIRDEIKKMSK